MKLRLRGLIAVFSLMLPLMLFLMLAGCGGTSSGTASAPASVATSATSVQSPASQSTPATPAPQFWVSPTGSDAAPGTQSSPFQTLEHARDVVRTLPANVDGDVVVNVMGGTYRLSEPLVLDWRDSGRNGHNVVYRAVTGQQPVISGAMQVTGWTLSDPALNIYRAYVGQRASRQLYVNGRRAVRAQTTAYPSGFLPAFFWLGNVPLSTGGIEFIPTSLNPAAWNDPSKWTNVQNIEAVITTQWKMMRVPLQSVTPFPNYTPNPFTPSFHTGLIAMQEPAWTNANVFVGSTGQPNEWSFWQVTRFENAYQFLDQPGEWYLDQNAGWLYYIPLPGESLATADIELPLLESLVQGQGTLQQPISNISFQGLTFAYATWLTPSGSNGYVTDQSGFTLTGTGHLPNVIGHDPNDTRTPGNVHFEFAHAVTFSGNIFTHLGAMGLDFDTGSQGNTIDSNLFVDISASAIELGGISLADHAPSQPGQITQGNVITNNLIRQAGVEFADTAGIMVGFTAQTLIQHNTIYDVPWSGIAVGWGWGLLDATGFPGLGGATPFMWGEFPNGTPNSGNKILNNRIDTFLGVLWDAGAIYTTGQQGTSASDPLILQGNVASNKRPRGGGNVFYTDGGSRYVLEQGNVSLFNPQGVSDFGPPPKPGDPLPYPAIYSALNGIPYGSDTGGCVTYGDISFVGNYWLNAQYYDVCPYSANGVAFPTGLTYSNNHLIQGLGDIPTSIINSAGAPTVAPATIPADQWIVPPLVQ